VAFIQELRHLNKIKLASETYLGNLVSVEAFKAMGGIAHGDDVVGDVAEVQAVAIFDVASSLARDQLA
jgi:hypothetical protein